MESHDPMSSTEEDTRESGGEQQNAEHSDFGLLRTKYSEPLTGSDTLRELKGQLYDYDVENGELAVDGKPIFVRYPSRYSGEIHGDTGCVVWDGSVILAKYLEWRSQHGRFACENGQTASFPFVHGRRVLELGAGMGFVGLTCAALGARETVITDLPYTHAALKAGVAASTAAWADMIENENNGEEENVTSTSLTGNSAAVSENVNVPTVKVCELDWFAFPQLAAAARRGVGHAEEASEEKKEESGDGGALVCAEDDSIQTPDLKTLTAAADPSIFQPFDLIIGAEVFWLDHLMSPLMDTLKTLFQISPAATLLISYISRGDAYDARLRRHFHEGTYAT